MHQTFLVPVPYPSSIPSPSLQRPPSQPTPSATIDLLLPFRLFPCPSSPSVGVRNIPGLNPCHHKPCSPSVHPSPHFPHHTFDNLYTLCIPPGAYPKPVRHQPVLLLTACALSQGPSPLSPPPTSAPLPWSTLFSTPSAPSSAPPLVPPLRTPLSTPF